MMMGVFRRVADHMEETSVVGEASPLQVVPAKAEFAYPFRRFLHAVRYIFSYDVDLRCVFRPRSGLLSLQNADAFK